MATEGDDPADRQAMVALAGGDDRALDAIMQRWGNRLIAFLHRLTGDRATSADLAQETFVRVYKHRKSYQPQLSFSTWIFTIATNLARNHLRWRQRHPIEFIDGDDHPGLERAVSEDDPAGRTMLRERLAAVQSAISGLPYDLRSALVLATYEQLSHEEIAAVLDTTPKAVEMRIYRARRQLRDQLGRYLDEA